MGDWDIILKSTYGKSVTVLFLLTNTTEGAVRVQFPELLSSHLGKEVIGQMWEKASQRAGAERLCHAFLEQEIQSLLNWLAALSNGCLWIQRQFKSRMVDLRQKIDGQHIFPGKWSAIQDFL